MVDPIHQKHIYSPEINANMFVYIDRWLHFWNSRASGTSRHQSTRELPLEQRPNFHQAGDPTEKYADLLKHWYFIIV